MSKIKNCPYCGIGLTLKDDYFWHPLNECVLDGFIIRNEKDHLEKWNTRKPTDAIIKQLDFQAKTYNKKADEFLDKNVQMANHYRGKASSYEHALEIVKGF